MDFSIRAANLEDCKDIARMILVSRAERMLSSCRDSNLCRLNRVKLMRLQVSAVRMSFRVIGLSGVCVCVCVCVCVGGGGGVLGHAGLLTRGLSYSLDALVSFGKCLTIGLLCWPNK